MIYIVEIPHQRDAFCWTACGEQDFINRVMESHERARSDMPIEPTLESCEKWLGHDLSALYIFPDEETAKGFFTAGGFHGHQALVADAALRRELGFAGIIC